MSQHFSIIPKKTIDFYGKIFYYKENNNNYHVYNLVTGKSATFEANDIDYNPMYIRVEKSNDITEYYNKNFKLIYTQND